MSLDQLQEPDTSSVEFWEAQSKDAKFEEEQVAIGHNQIVWAMEHSSEFFIEMMLTDALDFPVPEFHKDVWALLTSEDNTQLALAMPRGHAKTTLARLAVVWHLLFTDYQFVIYASNTFDIAVNSGRDIIQFLEHPNLAQFIKIDWSGKYSHRQDGKGSWRFDLTTPSGKKKNITLKCVGAGQQMRGININNARPDLGVIDDLEDDDNTATDDLRKKTKRWFFGPFKKAFSRKRNKLFYLGNMISEDGLLNGLVKSNYWSSVLYGCLLSDGTPLWPDMWSYEQIQADYHEYKEIGETAKWFAEMMNMPRALDKQDIDVDLIQYQAPYLKHTLEAGFVTIDPAFSEKNWADETGIALHGLVQGRWMILEGVKGRWQPDKVWRLAISLCRDWGINTIGVETQGGQAAVGVLFQTYRDTAFDQSDIQLCTYPAKAAKSARIISWYSLLKKGPNNMYALRDDDMLITTQLMDYKPENKENKDDLIDACSSGLYMIRNYMGILMKSISTPQHDIDIRLNDSPH